MDDQKHSGNGLDTDNVVSFKNHKKKAPAPVPPSPPKEPLVNLPDGVKALVGFMLLIHVGLWGISHFTSDDFLFLSALNWGFIPARFSGDIPFLPTSILTPLTYTLLHGSWMHLIMNGVMLMAFGSGFEKMLGLKKMMLVFWGSSLIAAFIHFLLDPHAIVPMVGASGGLSGLFAGMILILHKTGRLTPNKRLFPAIAVFIGISIVFGLLGGPDGSMIAWAAHVGGFLGGLGLTHFILKKGLYK